MIEKKMKRRCRKGYRRIDGRCTKKRSSRIIAIAFLLIGLAMIILPTFTPDDTFTTLPLILFLKQYYLFVAVPIGIVLLVSGLVILFKNGYSIKKIVRAVRG